MEVTFLIIPSLTFALVVGQKGTEVKIRKQEQHTIYCLAGNDNLLTPIN